MLLEVNTGVRHPLALGRIDYGAISWSPNASEIVFAADGDLWIAPADGGSRRLLLGGTAQDHSPVWSPDGARIAFGRGLESIHVVDVDGRNHRTLVERGTAWSWSPDGAHIAFARDDSVHVVAADGGGLRTVGRGRAPAWAPDSRRLAAASAGELVAYTIDDRRMQVLARCSAIGDPAWAPGPAIAFGGRCGDADGLYRLDPEAFMPRRLADVEVEQARAEVEGDAWYPTPVWAPDGSQLAYVWRGWTYSYAVLLAGDGSSSRELLEPPSGFARDPAWSADGRNIAVSGVRVFATGVVPTVHDVTVRGPSWAPDAKRVVGTEPDSGNIKIVDVDTGFESIVYEGPVGRGEVELYDPDWSPDGRLIVVAWARGLGFYGQGRRPALTVGSSLRAIADPDWSPDGRRIAFSARTTVQSERSPPSIYVVAPNRAPRLIVKGGYMPTWSPEGKRLAFVRDVTPSNSEIFVIGLDGRGLRRLTFHPGPDVDPNWRPRARSVSSLR